MLVLTFKLLVIEAVPGQQAATMLINGCKLILSRLFHSNLFTLIQTFDNLCLYDDWPLMFGLTIKIHLGGFPLYYMLKRLHI